MRKTFFVLHFIMIAFVCKAQSESTYWYFGEDAGVNFNSGLPVALTNSGMDITSEGSAVISDLNGNLLFYTNGEKVWDSSHQLMPNGDRLTGHRSTSQSSIIIPNPINSTSYYVFTLDEQIGEKGLKYSEVDMSLNSGLGDVTFNKNITLTNNLTEKMTAVKHANGVDYWVVVHEMYNNKFLSYKVTSAGVNSNPVVSFSGTDHSALSDFLGHMKISSNTEHLVSTIRSSSVIELFDFDNNSGLISNPLRLDDALGLESQEGSNGVEFSPNSNLLYTTIGSFSNTRIYQFNVGLNTDQQILNSNQIIYESGVGNSGEPLSSMQLALDRKIYIAKVGEPFLDVISNPNEEGISANYINQAVNLNQRMSLIGLPSFIATFLDLDFRISQLCFGQETAFTLNSYTDVASIDWDFGDGTIMNALEPTHNYNSTGNYEVIAQINFTTGDVQNINKNIEIYEVPIAYDIEDYVLCETNESIVLTDFDSQLRNGQSNDFIISYHLNLQDANVGQNLIENGNFDPILDVHTIFARITNPNNRDCFDITSFSIITIIMAEIDIDDNYILCAGQDITISANTDYDLYNWSNGSSTSTIIIDSIGTYQLEVTNNVTVNNQLYSCTKSLSFTVTLSDFAEITNVDVIDVSANNSIYILADGTGDYEYSLDGFTFQDAPFFQQLSETSYTVHVKDKNGCGTITKVVYLLVVPKFFTPNNDGVNDLWQVKSSFSEQDLQIEIFNRYGKLISNFDGNSLGWDGTLQGSKLETNDYWYKIIRPSKNKIYTGHFTLKR